MQVFHFKDKLDDVDVQFAEYLKGKSIAVMGCAALDNLEQGEFIDSHDVVVRIHSPIPYSGYQGQTSRHELGIVPDWSTSEFVPEEWQSRIGCKVHVFYHKIEHLSELKQFLPLFHGAGGTFLAREIWYYTYNPDYVEVCRRSNTRHLTHNHCINMLELLGAGVYAGNQIIGDILRFDVGSVYLTGVPTFFDQDGVFIPDAPKTERHMAFINFHWLRELYTSYPLISVDANMQSLFSLIPDSYHDYMNQYGRFPFEEVQYK